MPLSVEVLGNGTEVEPGAIETEAIVTENWAKHLSDASGLTWAGF